MKSRYSSLLSLMLVAIACFLAPAFATATEPDTAVVWVGPSKHTWQGQVRAIHQSPTAPTFQFHSSAPPICFGSKNGCVMRVGKEDLGPWTLFFFVNDEPYTYQGCRALDPDLLFDYLIDFGFDVEFTCP